MAAFHLGPVADSAGRAPEDVHEAVHALSAACCACACRGIDETTAPVLDPGRGRTKTGYLWALARDDRASHQRCVSGAKGGDDPPGVVYFYAPDRRGENAEKLLKGLNGTLQLPSHRYFVSTAGQRTATKATTG